MTECPHKIIYNPLEESLEPTEEQIEAFREEITTSLPEEVKDNTYPDSTYFGSISFNPKQVNRFPSELKITLLPIQTDLSRTIIVTKGERIVVFGEASNTRMKTFFDIRDIKIFPPVVYQYSVLH